MRIPAWSKGRCKTPKTWPFKSDRKVMEWFGPSLRDALPDSALARLSLTSVGSGCGGATLQGHWGSEVVQTFQWLCACLQLNYAESRLTQLEGCHCERTCSANGLVYRDKELWVEPENCRNCACKVSIISIKTSKETERNKYINMDMTLPPLVLECLRRKPDCTDANININLTMRAWPSNIRELHQF